MGTHSDSSENSALAKRHAAVVLRSSVGFVLIASAMLKVCAISDAKYVQTLAWEMAGGRPLALIGFSAIEAFLGSLLLFGVRPLVTGGVVVALVTMLTALVAVDQVRAVHNAAQVRPCGCLGSFSTSSRTHAITFTQNGVLVPDQARLELRVSPK